MILHFLISIVVGILVGLPIAFAISIFLKDLEESKKRDKEGVENDK